MHPLPPRMDTPKDHCGGTESLSQMQIPLLEQASKEQAKGFIKRIIQKIWRRARVLHPLPLLSQWGLRLEVEPVTVPAALRQIGVTVRFSPDSPDHKSGVLGVINDGHNR